MATRSLGMNHTKAKHFCCNRTFQHVARHIAKEIKTQYEDFYLYALPFREAGLAFFMSRIRRSKQNETEDTKLLTGACRYK